MSTDRDKADAERYLEKWGQENCITMYEGLDALVETFAVALAEVRATGQRNFINNIAAVLDADDVEAFTALILKARRSPDLNNATRSALKSEAEVRRETWEAAIETVNQATHGCPVFVFHSKQGKEFLMAALESAKEKDEQANQS